MIVLGLILGTTYYQVLRTLMSVYIKRVFKKKNESNYYFNNMLLYSLATN